MRASLKTILRRLPLFVLLTCGIAFKAVGHDLPADRSLPEIITADCFSAAANAHRSTTAPSVVAAPLTAAAEPADASRQSLASRLVPCSSSHLALFQSCQQLLANVANPAELLSTTWRRMASQWSASNDGSAQVIVIARPAVGSAPRPKVNSLVSRPVKRAFIEDYMPYDFNLSDWRFGQAAFRGPLAAKHEFGFAPCHTMVDPRQSARSAEATTSPEPSLESDASLAVGAFLRRLSDAQSRWSELLDDRQELSRAIDQTARNAYQSLSRRFAKIAVTADSTAARMAQSGPQFVVYDTAVGGHILLTIAQAKEWEFDVPTAKSQAAKLVTATIEPLQSFARTQASRQLERAGNALLHLSEALSGGSQTSLAERSPAELR